MSYGSAREFFEDLREHADSSRAPGLEASYRFEITGAGTWRVDVHSGRVDVAESDGPADCTVATDERTFVAVVNKEQSPMGAYMTGKIRVEGDLGLALRLRDLVG